LFPSILITPNGEFVMKLTAKRQEFLDYAGSKYGAGAEITKVDVDNLMSEMRTKYYEYAKRRYPRAQGF